MRRGRLPRPVTPIAVQARYYAGLRAMLALARALLLRRVLPRLEALAGRARTDAAQAPGKRINTLVDQSAEAFWRRYPQRRMERLAQSVAQAASEHQRQQLLRQASAALSAPLAKVVDRGLRPRVGQFVAENVALIKSVPQRLFDEVEKELLAGLRDGQRHEQLARTLEDRLGVAESRAKLIARDQVLKFSGDLNRVRQEAMGVSQFIWRTSGDQRVREAHAERDGQVYSWADPPGDAADPGDGAFPGDGILCRCWAEPVFEEG